MGLDLLIPVVAIVCGFVIRSQFGYSIPSYSPASPLGLLKSDPALLYWFTERIADNRGSVPADFAASKAIQWPDPVDLRVEFPMAQPWLAANGWRLWRALGGSAPLHAFCIGFFALLASLTAIGAYGLTRELTGRRKNEPAGGHQGEPGDRRDRELDGRRDLAAAATLLWLLLAANYRTIGFVLLGEDLSIPALALHLWLVARAARLRTPASFLLAGLALLAAMATWHAAGFFIAMEAGAFFLWYLRSGENPFAPRGSWLVLLPLLLGCAVEPMLRGKLQALSLPMLAGYTLLLMRWIERRRTASAAHRPFPAALRAGSSVALLATLFGLALAASRAAGAGLGDYSHVFGLIEAKLRFLGHKPADPAALPFEVRLLWQGPFETASLRDLLFNLGFGLLGLLAVPFLAAPTWRRGRGGNGGGPNASAVAVLAPLALASLFASWLIVRTFVLAGLLAPVGLALLLAPGSTKSTAGGTKAAGKGRRLALAGFAPPIMVAALCLPLHLAASRSNPWHTRAWKTIQEVKMVEENVPAGAAVACDEIGSTAILAHTGRPILAQPKYEWTAARARLAQLLTAMTRGTPEELAAFLDAHDCRYVLLDTTVLWGGATWWEFPARRRTTFPGARC